jgi:hypothetical protein
MCHRDTLISIYSLISFFKSAESHYPVYIIDDGSLNQLDKFLLNHFFYVIFESKECRQDRIKKITRDYKYLSRFLTDEKTTYHKYKISALFLCPFKQIIYLDSDVLFLNACREIQSWIKNPRGIHVYTTHSIGCKKQFTAISQEEYTYRLLLSKFLNKKYDPLFNSGILMFPNNPHYVLPRLESIFFKLYMLERSNQEMAEECALSILFSGLKSKSLPTEQYINAPFVEEYQRIKKTPEFYDSTISIHYNNYFMKKFFIHDCMRLFF